MREWLSRAEGIGEVKKINNADPRLEISTISQINARNMGPALLFERMKGYEDSKFRIVTNSVANVKLFNLTFGLPLENGISETTQQLRGKPNEWTTNAPRYPLHYVDHGPITENVEYDDQIDLTKLPVPLWHDLDGGQFIGTGVAVITMDQNTNIINSGCYRAQLFERRIVGLNAEKGKHGNLQMKAYFERNEKMPIVMVFGPDPLSYVLAGSEIPTGISELEYQGAIMEKSVDVIRGKRTGLPIPAGAEIAIEGFVYPNKTKLEGPHGEWLGYYASGALEKPFVEVESFYYRNDAIMLGAVMSKGSYNDHALWRSIWKSALIYDELIKNGIPNIRAVYAPPCGVGRQFIVVSIKQSYPGHATEAGYMASQTRSAAYMGKWVVVVDDDINPFDMEDVLWAICTRSDPSEIGVIKRAWASGVDPLRPKDVQGSIYTNTRGIIFAVKPYERYSDFPKTCFATEDARKATFEKWGHLFDNRWTYA